jgi:hypothetical protein
MVAQIQFDPLRAWAGVGHFAPMTDETSEA